MISIVTRKFSTTIPERVLPGQELSAGEAALLQRIFASRMKTRVAYWIEKKNIPPAEAREHLAAECLAFTFEEKDETLDPISIEAMRLAREIVRKRLAQEGIEIEEESLDRHAAEVARVESVQAKAREIIALRQKSAREILGVSGNGG